FPADSAVPSLGTPRHRTGRARWQIGMAACSCWPECRAGRHRARARANALTAGIRGGLLALVVLAQLCPQRSTLPLHVPDLRLQLQDPADARQAHARVRELDHVLDHGDLTPCVPALAATRPGRLDHVQLIEAPKERLLDLEHD